MVVDYFFIAKLAIECSRYAYFLFHYRQSKSVWQRKCIRWKFRTPTSAINATTAMGKHFSRLVYSLLQKFFPSVTSPSLLVQRIRQKSSPTIFLSKTLHAISKFQHLCSKRQSKRFVTKIFFDCPILFDPILSLLTV